MRPNANDAVIMLLMKEITLLRGGLADAIEKLNDYSNPARTLRDEDTRNWIELAEMTLDASDDRINADAGIEGPR